MAHAMITGSDIGGVFRGGSHDDVPVGASVKELSYFLLGALQGVVGAPPALNLIRCGNRICLKEVLEGALKDVCKFHILQAQGERIEARLAPHGREVDQRVGVVAHVVGGHVLNGVHGVHREVFNVRLAEAHVVLDQRVTARQNLAVCNPHVGRLDEAVVKIEGFNVEIFIDLGFWSHIEEDSGPDKRAPHPRHAEFKKQITSLSSTAVSEDVE